MTSVENIYCRFFSDSLKAREEPKHYIKPARGLLPTVQHWQINCIVGQSRVPETTAATTMSPDSVLRFEPSRQVVPLELHPGRNRRRKNVRGRLSTMSCSEMNSKTGDEEPDVTQSR